MTSKDVTMTITGPKAKRIAKTAGILAKPQTGQEIEIDFNTKVRFVYRAPKRPHLEPELDIIIEAI